MANAQLTGDLSELLLRLGELLHTTPITDPNYDALEDAYDNVYRVTQASLAKAIDEEDKDYADFATRMTAAMQAVKKAQTNINALSNAVDTVAQVVDLAGKIAKKVV